jgi:hypothetical protein
MIGMLGMLGVGTVAAQTPCDGAADLLVVNPGTMVAELPDHTTLILDTQTPLVAGYELRVYQEVVPRPPAPFAVVPIPRAAWTLVPGSTTCYTATLPDLSMLARNVRHRAGLVALGSHGINSPVPTEESNPFGWVGAPRAVTRPRVTR